MTIEDFISNVRKLSAKAIIIEAAGSNLEELADLNVEQRHQGFLSDGNRTPEYSSEAYKQLKRSLGSKSLPYMDFKLEGDFDEGQYAKIEGDKLKFGSNDVKEKKLETIGGKNIFGVTTDNLIEQIDSDVVKVIDKLLMS